MIHNIKFSIADLETGYSKCQLQKPKMVQISIIRNFVLPSWFETFKTQIRKSIKLMNKESFAAWTNVMFDSCISNVRCEMFHERLMIGFCF